MGPICVQNFQVSSIILDPLSITLKINNLGEQIVADRVKWTNQPGAKGPSLLPYGTQTLNLGVGADQQVNA